MVNGSGSVAAACMRVNFTELIGCLPSGERNAYPFSAEIIRRVSETHMNSISVIYCLVQQGPCPAPATAGPQHAHLRELAVVGPAKTTIACAKRKVLTAHRTEREPGSSGYIHASYLLTNGQGPQQRVAKQPKCLCCACGRHFGFLLLSVCAIWPCLF